TLLALFNAMLIRSYIPEQMKVGIIITLFKGGNKRKDDPNNYRAIRLTSTILKLLERILLKRIIADNGPFNPLQGGFQMNMGCNMTSLLLQESVYFAKENGSKLYICFLDAKKAFDKVWHDGLFFKLHQMGIAVYVWKLIVSLHTQLSSYVLFRGFKSSVFSVTQGTRQGGVLSPYLFLCFINDLLNQLCMSDKGLCVSGINICCPTVADDMLLQSLTKLGLQTLINICATYFYTWRLEYNVSKCAVLVCNESDRDYKMSSRQWTLGNAPLTETDSYTHLGIVCNKKMDMKVNILESSLKIKRIFFGLIRSSFCEQDLHPLTLKRIYETIVLPKALYGCEFWSNMSLTDSLLLERSHRLCLKTLQGIDRTTRTCVALSMIGSVNLQYEILKRKATLFGQLCRLNPHFAVKRLFLYRVTSNYFFKDLRYGFILDIFRFLEDNNIEQILVEYINSGVFPSKYTWKRIVHEQLKSKAAFNTRLEIDEEGLGRFLNIHQETKPSLFWELSRRYPYMLTACRTVVRLIAASYNKYQPQTICLACGEVVSQFVDHCLLWCHANSRVRHKMWTGLWHKFGIDVYVRLASLPCCTLIDALFGNFDTVADIISTDRKDEFYCFVARYVHILKIHLCQSFNEGSFEVDSTV
ncbi:MAG: reverse transcriptase family protein, partial [Candidatus Thiodiazotropha endolucinida]|nr:reverse transcriptase family protein [Candidatus Thiodiazotropha taylori]MCW4259995.1 reverse transcriptase family protein [Candidatus Thiodiazotropha endolucinida]